MVFKYGKDLLKEGLKTYFQKYSFKNTELVDFITELDAAAKRLSLTTTLLEWTDTWLKKAGCNRISTEIERDESTGVISSFKLNQAPYNIENTPENILREQAFNIASLDEDMKIIEVHRV